MEKNKKIDVKKLFLVLIYVVIFLCIGGTLAGWVLEFNDQLTDISFLVEGEEDTFTCSADGGEPIVPSDVVIMPSTCNSSGNVIKREITTNVEIDTSKSNVDVLLEMWLTVNEIGLPLSESENFRYVVTTTPNSCTSDIVGEGTFNGKKKGDKVPLFNKTYSLDTTDKYYLYIWLDEVEENPETANQSFNLSLGGTCIGNYKSYVTFDFNGGEFATETVSYTTSGEYEFVVPYDGEYQLEAWGAQGGSYGTVGGYGGYTSGKINLSSGEKIYAYVGQSGSDTGVESFNGGGGGGNLYNARDGGGATDFRLVKGDSYSDVSSLASRIMVAGGGGGSDYYDDVGSNGGDAGGLNGYDGGYYRSVGSEYYSVSTGGTQISGGEAAVGVVDGSSGIFGIGGTITDEHGGGGGGGYYGGGSGTYNNSVVGSGAGGSSFISGHTGCVAISSSESITPRLGNNSSSCKTGTTDNLCSVHYSGKVLTDTIMIDGNGYKWTNVKGSQIQMPDPSGESYDLGIGHGGDGYARITFLNVLKELMVGELYGDMPIPTKEGYGFVGWNTKADGSGAMITESSIVNMKTNHTLYAIWDSIYTVSFDSNGGELETETETEIEIVSYTTSGEYVFAVPYDGKYQLEVWGAQGGYYNTVVGGYGGYSKGSLYLTENQNLYLVVGGAAINSNGGYNGGGDGNENSNITNSYGSGGGGATHIALSSGLLSTFESNTNDILIVAGGGGGGAENSASNGTGAGGAGGGIIGNNGKGYYYGFGGTQTSGGQKAYSSTANNAGSFGLGSNADPLYEVEDTRYYAGGGGGGYYGGSGGSWSTTPTNSGGGGGGSGYIGNSLLKDKYMYCYECTTSSDASTLTYSTTNVSEEAVANYAKSGNGAAKITFLSSTKDVVYSGIYGKLPIPTRENYVFYGWNTESDGSGTVITADSIVEIASAHTLYAMWEPKDFNVLFNVNGGIIDATTTSVDGNTTYNWTTPNDIVSLNGNSNFYIPGDLNNIDLPNYNDINYMNISKNGFVITDNEEWICLDGCSVENEVYSQNELYSYSDFCDYSSESCNITLGVNWKVIYKISYDANGGSGAPDSQEKIHGITVYLSNIVPTRDGYKFLGWSTLPLATSASYTKGSEFTINDNINLFAVWQEITPLDSYHCANESAGSSPYMLTYDGYCRMIDDGNGNWRIKFLSVGTYNLSVSDDMVIDAFLVGGGGGGNSKSDLAGGGGGGGGYTKTAKGITLTTETSYSLTIGSGGSYSYNGSYGRVGGDTSGFDLTAYGGGGGGSTNGGSGGSGGGGGGFSYDGTKWAAGAGGSYGSNGFAGGGYSGGSGQGGTTCEFEEGTTSGCTNGDDYAYAGGGGGGGGYGGFGTPGAAIGGGGRGSTAIENNASSGAANTGGGGGGAGNGTAGSGGSGIIVIRNSREVYDSTSVVSSYKCSNRIVGSSPYLMEYSGNCTVIDDGDGNWRVKFLSEGTYYLDLTEDIEIDAFLVGGGGGGNSKSDLAGGGGGGGGYTKTAKGITLTAGTSYPLTIGSGGSYSYNGSYGWAGGDTSGFDLTAYGGGGGGSTDGGAGGSGGGGGGFSYDGAKFAAGAGGSYGSNGFDGGYSSGGSGQGGTTCEFEEGTTSGCTNGAAYAYAGGGGGGGGYGGFGTPAAAVGGGGRGSTSIESGASSGTANTGGGGGGAGNGVAGSGGSGIIVIRNAR